MLLHITMYGLKMHLTGSTCLPVDNSKSNEWIFMKFHTGDLH